LKLATVVVETLKLELVNYSDVEDLEMSMKNIDSQIVINISIRPHYPHLALL